MLGLPTRIVTVVQAFVRLCLDGIVLGEILGEWIIAGKFVGMDMTTDTMIVMMAILLMGTDVMNHVKLS